MPGENMPLLSGPRISGNERYPGFIAAATAEKAKQKEERAMQFVIGPRDFYANSDVYGPICGNGN